MGYDLYIVGGDLEAAEACFEANAGLMEFLRAEMRHYGMLNDAVRRRPRSYIECCVDGRHPEAWEPQPVLGIPTFKLTSNDYELVTTGEVSVALRTYDAQTHRELPGPQLLPEDDLLYLEYIRLAQAGLVPASRYRLEIAADGSTHYHFIAEDKAWCWENWTAFLRRAEHCGGFRVG
jgi:hypothetical protein